MRKYKYLRDLRLLELYQDENDTEAGREIALRIRLQTWTLGDKR